MSSGDAEQKSQFSQWGSHIDFEKAGKLSNKKCCYVSKRGCYVGYVLAPFLSLPLFIRSLTG